MIKLSPNKKKKISWGEHHKVSGVKDSAQVIFAALNSAGDEIPQAACAFFGAIL